MMTDNKKHIVITTDQMRFDALGCNGGRVRERPASIRSPPKASITSAPTTTMWCMPARAASLRQHVGTHGVWMNGVTLPEDYPTVAHALGKAGYNTALIGKAHEPWLVLPMIL